MRRWAAGALVAFGFACAGAPPLPADRLAQAEAEVRAAQEIGAERAPQAKVHLQAARDTITNARETNEDDPEGAARKLEVAHPSQVWPEGQPTAGLDAPCPIGTLDLPYPAPRWDLVVHERSRKINRVSIANASRPRLRPD